MAASRSTVSCQDYRDDTGGFTQQNPKDAGRVGLHREVHEGLGQTGAQAFGRVEFTSFDHAKAVSPQHLRHDNAAAV
jgi:hypothetical protein